MYVHIYVSKQILEPGFIAYTFNPITEETKAG